MSPLCWQSDLQKHFSYCRALAKIAPLNASLPQGAQSLYTGAKKSNTLNGEMGAGLLVFLITTPSSASVLLAGSNDEAKFGRVVNSNEDKSVILLKCKLSESLSCYWDMRPRQLGFYMSQVVLPDRISGLWGHEAWGWAAHTTHHHVHNQTVLLTNSMGNSSCVNSHHIYMHSVHLTAINGKKCN